MLTPPRSTLMPARYRLAVASRALAAVAGGYALASALAASLAVTLPLPRPEAVLAGQMLSLVAYAVAVMWVFAASSAWRAWGGVLAASGALAALYLLARGMASL